jgi:hypothetical protein
LLHAAEALHHGADGVQLRCSDMDTVDGIDQFARIYGTI